MHIFSALYYLHYVYKYRSFSVKVVTRSQACKITTDYSTEHSTHWGKLQCETEPPSPLPKQDLL